jgi:hypothetical protein
MRAKEFLDKPTLSAEQVAKKHGVSIEYVNQQLVNGVKHEHEHTSDSAIAREIALDHLGEDPDYYKKLTKVEKVDEDDMFAAPKVTARKLAALMQAGKELWVKDSRNEVWKINKIEQDPLQPKRWLARWDYGEFVVGDDEYKLDILEPDESAYMLRPVHRFAESDDDMFATKKKSNLSHVSTHNLVALLQALSDEEYGAYKGKATLIKLELKRRGVPLPDDVAALDESDDDMFAAGPSALVRAKHLLDKSKSVYIEHPYYDEVLPVFSIYVDENTPRRYSDSVTVLLKNWRHLEHEVNADEWTLAPFANGFVLKKKATNEDAEVLDEGASSVLYHYTSPAPALRILKSSEFELTSSVGSQVEAKIAPKGYPYYLSTTRNKLGDYHARIPGSHAVMFVLNGTKLSHNYKVKPVDYWEGMWQRDNANQRTREAEDRVFSKTPTIPTAGIIKEIHQLVTDQDEFRSPVIRQLAILAKTQGIPIYFYADKESWLLQAPNRRITVSQLPGRFSGPAKQGWARHSSRISRLEQWVELLYKKNKSELSQEANELRYNLVYYGARYPEEDQSLANDLTNARKPNEPDRKYAAKLIEYMRKYNLSTVDFKNAMVAKWEKAA